MNDLIDVLTFLWEEAQPFLVFSLSFAVSVGIISNLKDLIRWK